MSIERIPQTKEINVKIALDKINEGDFMSALRYLNNARNIDPCDENVLSDIAETYFKMGLYDVCAYVYAQLFHKSPSSMYLIATMSACWYAIGKGIGNLNEMAVWDDKAEHLIADRMVTNKNLRVITERASKVTDEFESKLNRHPIIDVREKRASVSTLKAYSYMHEDKFKEAREEALKVSEDSTAYKDALGIIIQSSLALDDDFNALIYTEKLLQKYPSDPNAMRYKLLLECPDGVPTESFEALFKGYERVLYESGQVNGLRHTSAVAFFAKRYDLAKSAFRKAEELLPYAPETLLTATYTELADGDLSTCKARIAKLNALFGEDPRIAFQNYLYKWYLVRCADGKKSEAVKAVCNFVAMLDCTPFELELYEIIRKSYHDPKDVPPETLWAIVGSGNPALSTEGLTALCEIYGDIGYEYCIKVLENPRLDTSLKRKALFIMLEYFPEKESAVEILCDNRIFVIVPKGYPSKAKQEGAVIYSGVYTELVFGGQKVDPDGLLAVVEKIASHFTGKRKWAFRVACAVAHYEYLSATKEEPHKEFVAGLYRISVQTLMKRHKEVFGK